MSKEAMEEHPAQQEPQVTTAPRNIIWDSRHPDYPVEWSNPGRPAKEGEVHYIRYDLFADAVHAAQPQPQQPAQPQQEPEAWLEILRNNKTATDEVIGAFLRGHAEYLTGETFVLSTPAAPQPAQQEPVALDVTLDGEEAQALYDQLGDDREDLSPVRLIIGEGHSGYGLYVAQAEYPDEGAVFIASVTSPPAQPQQESLTPQEFEALHWKAKGYVVTGMMDVVRMVEEHHNIKEQP